MTKVHFESLAAALKATRPPVNSPSAYATWEATVHSIANVCRTSSPLFVPSMFYVAAGL